MGLNIRWKLQRKLTCVYLLFLWHLTSTYGQGYFPKLVDLAVQKPITSTSTCGATASGYCQSSTSQAYLQTCFQQTCKFDCCADCGSSKPGSSDLAEFSNKVNVFQDGDPRNGSIVRSFRFQANSYIQPLRIPALNYVKPGFTISVWIKQKQGNKGTIISKDETTQPFANIFQLIIQDYNLMFHYKPVTGNASVASYTLLQSQSEKLQPNEWHLITVAVINKGLSYYIDGELMNANVATLTGPISDQGGSVVIGQKYGGTEQYDGLMQDILIYARALTNREAVEAFTGVLPVAYVASNCRCPPSHPKINVAEPAKCLKNLEGDLDTVSRLADTAHPIEFATDGDTLSFWLSKITENATINIDLSYSGLQVFYIVLTFYGPVPAGIKIKRSLNNGKTFQPWQYFAEDCSSFNLPNNGPLTEPDSVNCVQYVKPLQSSREVITFQTEYPPPPGSNIPVRPFGQGCSNLYCSQSLLQFLKATHVKFHFYNHTLVQNSQHRYYGLERIHVAGRCECFGHASSSSYTEGNATHPGRCVCDCHSSTNTEGETCNRCKPLYNNKPFQRGDQDDSYPCVKCECNQHADSCVYNQSLDTSPNSRTQGGGGVCIDCKHNTTGRFCQMCKKRFYRESGKSLKAADVCSPCGCEGPGVQSGKLDCVKDDSNSNIIAGQCECKTNTQGRQCYVCKDGFFDLKASHATGCVACGCTLDGTKNRSSSCHATTGQCDCKDRVTGTKCDTCKSGYYGLSGQEPLGCKTCDCDPFGTTARNVSTCNPVSGQCSCKPGVIGRKCDQCEDGFHSLTQNGCTSCNCSVAGTQPSLLDACDKSTGSCDCKVNVQGNNCDQCKQGFYNLSESNPQGCTQCACDTKGTVGGSGSCEQQSGNCTCKPLVVGQTCNQCKLGTFGLNQSNPNGCQQCNCFPKGTQDGDKKSPDKLPCSSNGQCFCLSSVSGLRCDSCVAEYYWNPSGQGCLQCLCDSDGSVGKNCNDTGHCTCKANIKGRQCNKCIDDYYGFENCVPCNCDPAGSPTSQCDASGKCTCKKNVEGDKCDQCKNGTVNLQQNNKYGCSGAPSEQPAPFVTVLSSRAMMLTWFPPDNPNGLILRYELYRNGSLVYTGLNQTFNDTTLTPDTVYYYYIITHTASGNTRSLDDGKLYRTFQDAPGGVSAPVITDILPRNASAAWQAPSMPNGQIIEYRLISTSSRNPAEVVTCQGILFSCKVGDLKPYTVYNFTVEACTNGGCTRSNVTTILTLPTLPDFQPAPNVTSLPGGTAVTVEWDEPPEPNGRILRYELYMRASPFTGDGTLKFNSNPAHDSNHLNFRKTNVTGLIPFTEYEFRVRTFTAQVRGDRASEWKRHRTGEGTPLGENAMNVAASPLNSSSVVVSWSPPQNPQGVITHYVIYKYQPPSSPTAVRAAEAPGSQRQGVVAELVPYTQYKFTVQACNSFACSGHSPEATAQTLAAAPEGQAQPMVLSVDSSAVYLKWSQPQTPNGPLPPSYNLSRAYSALYYPPPLVTEGVHFPGLGFYKFPSSFVGPGATNDIQFWFRTQYPAGLLMFLVSDGSQTDMLAVQMRDGKPWLIFDCQDGAAAFTISEAVRFDDGKWHQLKVNRRNRRGTLTVDSYQASQDSPGSATVISENTGVYIGGLPSTFTFLRQDTGNSKIEKISFIGCLRVITSNSRQLDWATALESFSVEPERNGCPARDKKKALLLRGGGYVAINSAKADILTSSIFSFTLRFRTQLSSGLLLFAYGPTTTFAIQFAANQVETMYYTTSGQGTVAVSPPSGEICDGNWHNLTLTNFHATSLTIRLDGNTVTRPSLSNLNIQSRIYIGGVPTSSEKLAQQAGVNVESSFGGCMIVQSAASEIDYLDTVTAMHNADLDGCLPESTVPVSSQLGQCLPFNSSVVYSGKTEKFNDSTADIFTDYLYRVESYHVGTLGSGKSPWIATRSGQGAPTGLQAPMQLTALPGGRTVRVTWAQPQRPNGVISEYRILSYRVHPPQSTPDETVITDTSALNATILGLQPYTAYEIRIQAFTIGGSSIGPGKNVTTGESVPESVPGPTAVRRPTELEVHWTKPVHPNGIITQYNLTIDGRVVYSGTSNNFTIRGLQVYTEYTLQLTACTRIGCAQGPEVQIRTGELPPEGVKTPTAIVRGRREVEVIWEEPSKLNGKIVQYEVLFATSDVLSAYVSKFNATPDVFSTVIRNLTAGTLYYVRVRPFTGGGGTFSNATQVTTHEDVPDDIPAPNVVALSPYSLFVIMLPPDTPNGVITRYELYQDSISDPVLNVTQLTNYTADGFTPYSRHTFRVRACTAKGCAYGALAVAFTQEIAPNGTVNLTASIRNATAVNARWTRVEVPNGKLFYNLMVYGKFIVQGSDELTTEHRVETAIRVEEAEKDFIYNGLLPFSSYTFWVNASNSVGFVLSNNVTDSTPEGVPDGLKAPNVTVLNSTSVHVTWKEPTLPNGVVIGYALHQKSDSSETVVYSGMGFSFTVTNLKPFTVYQFRVNASTVAGSGFSEYTQVTTSEDVPSSPDPPVFRDVASTSLKVVWDPPAEPNGVLLYYVIYQNGTEIKRVTGNVTSYVVSGLQPFSVYVFKLSVCTAVGCSNSSDSAPQRTLESGPRGLSAPTLTSPSGRTVVIEWDPPSDPNGIIQKYLIQRRVIGVANPSNVAEVNASLARRYVDNTAKPLTDYQYRIIAYNSGPGQPSPYSNVTTGQGDPEGIAAPTVQALSPYAIHVTWTSPTTPNGVVTHYIIRVNDQQKSRNTTVNVNAPFELNVTSLDPYIMYDVIVSACTVGGCGSSSPSQVRTLPAKPEMQPAPVAEAESQTSLRVKWDAPLRPNGVILWYELYRRTVEDLVENNITGPTQYVKVYQNNALVREFVDTGLGVFSAQQYKVTVITAQGNTTSNSSLPYRTGPAPPLAGATVNGTAVNHTSILVTWSPPGIKQLRGAVETYILEIEDTSLPSAPVSRVGTYPGQQTSVTVTNLKANTYYKFYVELDNGAGKFKSAGFRVRTLDGMPEGFAPPVLYTMSSTEIRVSWSPPTQPNGIVVSYKIYVNDTLWTNATGADRQAIASGLEPFTYYVIKVAVCTTHGCTLSGPTSATTDPAAPTGLAAPRLIAGSTSIFVQWEPPSRPNGLMSGYQIFRRMVYPCPTSPPPKSKCTFIECQLSEQLCGVTCYNPANQMCCNGVLHSRDPSKTCCGTSYLTKNQASDVCCGNTFHIQQADYQCCHGDYIQVASGRVCCPKTLGGSVVGLGNSCCGDTPYNKNDPSKVCVCGALYNPVPPRKCCGGKVVAAAQVCCGDEKNGNEYDLDASKSCCGSRYVTTDKSLCCKGSAGDIVVYNYTSAADKSASNHKCCGASRVSSGLSCCNEQGYNPSSQTCADKSSNGTVGCGVGTICNKTDASEAMCDRCDFDNTTMYCGFVPGHYAPTPSTVVPKICATDYEEILKNQYNPNLRQYNDTNLSSHTEYEYYIVAINNVANVTSPTAKNRTLMGRPEGLQPPVAVPISATAVRVTWSKPSKTNGVIQEYRLTRVNGQTRQRKVVYTGLNMTFTDRDLEPFTGYRYVIEACTTHCASAEMTSLIYTDQAAPVYVNATILLPVNFSAIKVSWVEPPKPNGLIIRYNVSRVINSTYKIHLNPHDKGLGMSLVIGGLEPYTNYTFEVIACTRVGCTASPLASSLTLQAPPEGVHPPNLTVTGAREIEASWVEPDVLNGVIVKYSLYRGDLLVYNGTDVCYKNQDGKDKCIFQDKGNGLQPVTSYSYTVSATTGGGTTNSSAATATTPESSPEVIPKPRLTVKSAYEILAEWDEPGQTNGNITSYSVIVNGTEHNVGLNMNKLITGLSPFTVYSVRVKACTAKGCGLGDREYNRTDEAPPVGQGAPTLVPQEWNVVQVSWLPPSSPNGIITQYEIYRKIGNSAPLLVCITSQLTCLNSGLLGYTVYSYRVRARNSAGFVDGPWENVRTPEGPPQGISPPTLNVLNSTAVYVKWNAPTQPNGIVTHYEVRYREELQVPDNSNITVASRVPSSVLNVTVKNLKPHTDYQFLIAAINSRREGRSAWATAKTKQAPPANLRPLQADKAADGKSIRLFWDEPADPNGIITHYKLYKDGVQLYRGAAREYTVPKLVPFTAYEFQLEACTVAGCTQGSKQIIYSAEVDPQGLSPPTAGFVNATVVQISWKPPAVPNGIIVRYEVYRTVTPVQKRRKRSVTPSSAQLVYSTNDTNKTNFVHTDTGLKPYTEYGYSVRAINNGGFIDSETLSVTTDQAAPTFIDAPLVTVIDAYSVNVTWKKPSEPNGVIQFYFVYRNGSIKYEGNGNEMSFVDSGLDAYTVYSYTIKACTSGVLCTISPPTIRRTAQAAPSGVRPPDLHALTAFAIKISWGVPDKPNGIITRYELYEVGDSSSLYTGLGTSIQVSNKQPYTKYSYYIIACTSAGCTQSAPAEVRTKEAPPTGLDPPRATVGGSSFVRVEWSPPSKPNGLILYYLITRNGTQVYNGTDLRFNDHTVASYTVYAYVVTAVNSVDRVTSSPGFSPPTNPGAPDNVSTPVLEVLSATSMKVLWAVPGIPNGVISKYEVLYNFKGSQGNAQIKDAGVSKETVLTGLLPYTLYEVRIRACTLKGCSTGEANSARTHEAPPQDQNPPDFPSSDIGARRVLVLWNEPLKPNGFMLFYRLYRRGASLSGNQLVVYGPEMNVANVTNGSALAYNDTDVKPYHKYEYRVISGNSAGETASAWSVVQTLSAPPEDLKAPHVNKTHVNSLEVFLFEPGTPNGEIRNYILEVSGQNVSEGLSTVREVRGLEPFTEYALRVYVCTDGGCAAGPSVTRRTSVGVPSVFPPPRPVNITATTITLEWDEPSKPNGAIKRYEVLYHESCADGCPTGMPESGINTGLTRRYTVEGLTPYTMYNFRIRVYNSLHSGLSGEQSVQTQASDPEITNVRPRVNVTGLRVAVDWSKCFKLNGPLDTYVLLENGLLIYEGKQNNKDLGTRPVGEYRYKVKATTLVVDRKVTVTAPDSATVELRTGPVEATAAPRTDTSGEWYKSVWFIAVMALIAIIILFVLLACCLYRTSGSRTVYVRDREPLPPRTKIRSRPPSMSSLYTSSDRKNGSMIEMNPMQNPYHSSTTALFDSTERLHRTADPYDYYDGSVHKIPLDVSQDWDGYMKSHSNRDSGLYDDEKLDLSDSEPSTPYQSFKREQYFTDTHL